MIRTVLIFVVAILSLLASASSVPADLVFEWATVGNPGNAVDPATGFGRVDYTYRISAYEVTIGQYAEFLNAVGAMDVVGLWDTHLEGVISRNGLPGSYSYQLEDAPNVAFVGTYSNAMRFVNWLHNGQPSGNIGGGTTEAGAYTIGSGLDEVRSPDARFFIPSEDEWYKAAYHDPREAVDFGPNFDDNFWAYPTKNDFAPIAELPPGGSNSTNMDYAIGIPTFVGSYSSTSSYYGTFDQAGNVREWNETIIGSARGVRGGGSLDPVNDSAATVQRSAAPTALAGFRVAAIPEPSSLLYGGLAMMLTLLGGKQLGGTQLGGKQ